MSEEDLRALNDSCAARETIALIDGSSFWLFFVGIYNEGDRDRYD